MVQSITPYSDNLLTYDENSGNYILTIEICKSELPTENINDDGILLKRIKKNSRIVYNYIYTHCAQANINVVERLLNYTQNGRKFLFDVLMAQMEADLESAYNDLGIQSPVNVVNGSTLDTKKIFDEQLCLMAKNIVNTQSKKYFGFNIMYKSVFPYYLVYNLGGEKI